jgi:hypothetical protein
VAAGEHQHRDRITECPDCGGPTRHERSKHVGEYDYCPRCHAGIACDCEGCRVLRALQLMGG